MFLILFIIILVVIFNKNLQRYILASILNWFVKKVSKATRERMNNDNETEAKEKAQTEEKSHKIELSELSKRKFENKDSDQYIDFEEMK